MRMQATVFLAAAALAAGAGAQDPQVQERVAEIQQAAAANKQALAQYTWQEQQTVSVKGEVKKQSLYQVRLGSDGKPQKTLIGSTPEAANGARRGPVRRRAVEKKTEEFEQYAQQVGALAQSYAHPEPQLLRQAFQQGNATLGSAGAPGEIELIVRNYIKPNDSVRFIFNRAQRAIDRVEVASYLTDPQDAVTMSIQFARLPDGTNHVADMTVNGVSRQLVVRSQNSNYVRA
jgi:hypothetical protein